MKTSIIIASINVLENVKAFGNNLKDHDCKVIVIDEGEAAVRAKNKKLLTDVPHAHYGPSEREEWFKKRFGSSYKKLLSVIPEKCHAETSFGFLVAYEEEPDMIVEIDDDVFPLKKQPLIDAHTQNLSINDGVTVKSEGKWYNTMENLLLKPNQPQKTVFPRGHPYRTQARNEDFIWLDKAGKSVLNMGLWAGCPDFDALTIVYNGGLNGQCNIETTALKRDKIVVGEDTYFAVCSMNTAFLPEIVPAFYQLYSNFMGIDRFDDIWSGVFLKKVADHLGKRVCLGAPMVEHRKRPRDTFKDLRKELEGMIINERLWELVDQAQIMGSTYWDAYYSLIQELEKKVPENFDDSQHLKFLKVQLQKMGLWLKVTEALI